MHGDLDPRFVFIIAAAQQVVDRDDGLERRQQVFGADEVIKHLADHRGPAKATADDDLIADLAVFLDDLQADIMGLDHRTVMGRARDSDLELARQELEFGVVGGPLPDQFGHRARIGDFIRGGTGEMVGGHVADGVTAGLDGVHVHFGQRVQHIGDITQLGPVVLDVLARGKMAVALIPFGSDIGQLVHLAAAERAIGDRDPQHIGMQLQIEPVHQAQGLEFILGQGAVDAAFDLCAELCVAFGDEGIVKFGVAVHY